MLKKDHLTFLNISEKESRILESIKNSEKNLYVISKETKICRTTLYPTIQKLFERGLITVKRKRNRYEYLSIKPEELINKLIGVIVDIESTLPKIEEPEKIAVPTPKKSFLKSLFKNKK